MRISAGTDAPSRISQNQILSLRAPSEDIGQPLLALVYHYDMPLTCDWFLGLKAF